MRGESRHVPSRPRSAGLTETRSLSSARLSRVLEPVVRSAGLDLETVKVAAAGPPPPVPRSGGRRERARPGSRAELSRSLSKELDDSRGDGRGRVHPGGQLAGVNRPLPRHGTGAGRRAGWCASAGLRGAGAPGHRRGPGDRGQRGRSGARRRRPAAQIQLQELGPGQVEIEFGGGGAAHDDEPGGGGARWTLT